MLYVVIFNYLNKSKASFESLSLEKKNSACVKRTINFRDSGIMQQNNSTGHNPVGKQSSVC